MQNPTDPTFSASERQRERERELERRYHARGGYDRSSVAGYGVDNSQLALYSHPDSFQNSTISIAPGYQSYGNPHSNRGQMMTRERESNVIEEPVVEHEHHHVHHHIDHGMIAFFPYFFFFHHSDSEKCWT